MWSDFSLVLLTNFEVREILPESKGVIMKQIIYFLFVLTTLFVNKGFTQWIQTNGPYGSAVYSLLVKENYVFATTRGTGVYYSTNNGMNWSPTSLTEGIFWDLAVNGTYIYAGGMGVYLSSDNGNSWVNQYFGAEVRSLTTSGGKVFAGTRNPRSIWYTSNNGIEWNRVWNGESNREISAIAMNNNFGFAGGWQLLLRSTNGGLNWTPISQMANETIYSLAINSAGIVFAGTSHGIYYSADNGINWIQLGLSGESWIPDIKIVGSTIYAVGTSKVYYSTDFGISWVQLAPFPISCQPVSIEIAGSNLLVGTKEYSVFLSSNNGSNWSNKLFGYLGVNGVTVSSGNLYAATEGNGVYKSTTQGSEWVPTSLLRTSILAIYAFHSKIFAGGYGYQYVSSNGGNNWFSYGTPGTVKGYYGVYPNIILAATSVNIQRAIDSGVVLDWRTVSNKSSYCFTALNGVLYAGTSDGVYFSTNQGVNWSQRALVGVEVVALNVSGSTLYAGVERTSAGQPCLYSSANNGLTWTEIPLPNPQAVTAVKKIVFNGSYMFIIATYSNIDKIYMTPDGGANWYAKNQGFPSQPTSYGISDLLVSGTYFYASVSNVGGGVWKRLISETINIKQLAESVPTNYFLQQNFPNPFNNLTQIKFGVPQTSKVQLSIYDLTGKKVATVIDQKLSEGVYSLNVDAMNLSSGVYFYELRAGNIMRVKKMVVLK